MTLSELEEILTSNSSEIPQLSREKVIECYSSSDIDILGACYVLVTEQKYVEAILPKINKSETLTFVRSYLEKCLLENPDSEWANSRYEAGWDTANWINDSVSKYGRLSTEVSEWMTWIKRIHLEGERDIRVCIETSVFEHLDDKSLVSKYLADPTY